MMKRPGINFGSRVFYFWSDNLKIDELDGYILTVRSDFQEDIWSVVN